MVAGAASSTRTGLHFSQNTSLGRKFVMVLGTALLGVALTSQLSGQEIDGFLDPAPSLEDGPTWIGPQPPEQSRRENFGTLSPRFASTPDRNNLLRIQPVPPPENLSDSTADDYFHREDLAFCDGNTPIDTCCRADKRHCNTGFIDFNTYWDTRDFAITTINAGAKLPHHFEYFQLANFYSPYSSNSFDWTDYYTEINLRRPISLDAPYLSCLDWTAQYADGSGPRGVLRLGIRWRAQDMPGLVGCFVKEVLKLKYSIDFHMIETDGSGWQIEHVYRRSFWDDRLYIAGFIDHNINNTGPSSAWVSEHQVGVRLFDEWHFVTEYRYKSSAPSSFQSGWGIGLEYVMRFK